MRKGLRGGGEEEEDFVSGSYLNFKIPRAGSFYNLMEIAES
jgi:hypothetical protein